MLWATVAEVILRSLPKPISYDETLVTKHRARHVLWLFPETPRTCPPISNLVSCTYVSSMKYHMGGREVGLRSRWPALWTWGLSAVKWGSTEWALRSLPASMGPDFTSQQGSCITGLRTFRLFPQAFEKYLRKIIFTVLLRNAFPSQCNSAF